MPVEQLIQLLVPFVVYGVTFLVTKIKSGLPGWVIVSIIVPVLGAIAAWLAQLIAPGLSWLQLFGSSFLAVFINELIRQLNQAKTQE